MPASRWKILLLVCSLGCAAPDESVDGRSSLLLLTLDTLRADRTSAYGYSRPTTPRLRALAAQGARFELAYAPAPITGPTHATLFTGLHPVGHGVVENGLVLDEAHHTLAERLAEAGYATAAIVSSFAVTSKFGFGQGFERFEEDFDPRSSSIVWKQWQGHRVAEGFDRPARPTTDRALAWLASASEDPRPFFLWVHYFDPHSPYIPPRHLRRFGGTLPDLYDAEVLYTDRQVGRLLDALDARGLSERTLVVVVGDHGEGLLDHGYMEHDFQLYEEALRVPLILRQPGRVAPGRVLRSPTSLVDVLPTVLGLVGLEPAGDVQGVSRTADLSGRAPAEDALRPVFAQRPHFEPTRVDGFDVAGDGFAVRSGRWKLIDLPGEGRRELYDLASDPGETRDVSGEHPERVRALASRIRDWQRASTRQSRSGDVSEEDRARLRAMGYGE